METTVKCTKFSCQVSGFWPDSPVFWWSARLKKWRSNRTSTCPVLVFLCIVLKTAQQHRQFNRQSIYLYLVGWLVSFCFVAVTSNLSGFNRINPLPGIRTLTDHLQGDLGVLVLVVYLKPEAENPRNLTNKTTYINSKLPLLFKVHEILSVDS